jgi:hypothetical protein
MDPVGVGLGTVALVSTVLEVFGLVISFRTYSETSRVLFRQLELEREVLLRWAIEVGLYPASHGSSTNCSIPAELLPLVHQTVATIGSLLAAATSPKGAKKKPEVGAEDLPAVLDRLQEELNTNETQYQSRLSRSLTRLGWAISEEDRLKGLITTIHAYNTSLHNLIPKPLQVSLDGSIMQALLAEPDLQSLLEIQRASLHWRKAISVAASVTSFQHQKSTPGPPSTNQLLLPRSRFTSIGVDMARYLTTYEHNGHTSHVMIEWRAYRIPRNSEHKISYLNTCLDLARLLHESQNLEAYRTLDSLGIIDDIEFKPSSRIGLVYRVPLSIIPLPESSIKVYTLHDLINGKEFTRPRLDERFALAQKLATGLHRLFVSRWYHKNLHSKNILFFTQINDGTGIAQPYLSGFDYARPDSPEEMTIKPEADEFCDRYRHPQCTHPDSRNIIRFSRRFDIYSLGVILTEIGRWETVDRMHKDYSSQRTKAKGGLPTAAPLDSFQRYLKTRCLESLGFRMGQIYTNAVRFCLGGDDAHGAVEAAVHLRENEEQLVSRLNKEVVAELAKCTA